MSERRIFTRYHLRTPFKDSWKLIRHIRCLINERTLKQISHEGTEDGDTYMAIILKEKISLDVFNRIMLNLENLEINPI